MKQILLSIVLLISFHSLLRGQALTIDETVKYINKTYFDNKEYKYYDTLTLAKDGNLKIFNNYTGWTYRMHVSEVEVTGVQDNSFKLRCYQPEPTNFNGIKIDNLYKTNCIITDVRTGARQEPKSEIYVSLKDPYLIKKLNNAYKYLFAIIRENKNYIRKDDDPFAPGNFNPNSADIKGSSNNSNVKLEISNGVYHVYVTIGGVKKKFVLDSGASDVSLSEEVERELINSGIIKKEYYIESALYKIADGSIVQYRRLILPEIKIGGFTVNNVKAAVGIGSTPLLLGKSFLDKFKKWSIDNTSQTLNLEK